MLLRRRKKSQLDFEFEWINLKKGFTYCTIFNSNSTWTKGDRVNLIKADGGYSIRTDSNKVEYDNLRFISEIE